MTKEQKYFMFCEAMMLHSEFANCLHTFGKEVNRGMGDPTSLRHYQKVTQLAKDQLRQKWAQHLRPEHEFSKLVEDIKNFVSELHQHDGMKKLQSLV